VTDRVNATTLNDPTLQPPLLRPGGQVDLADGRVRREMPGIEVTAEGTIFLAWRTRARYHLSAQPGESQSLPGSTVHVVFSADDARSWKSLLTIEPPCPGVSEYAATLWLDPQGTLWLAWAQGLLDGGSEKLWATTNADPAASPHDWTPPRLISAGFLANKPTFLKELWLLPLTTVRSLGAPRNLMTQSQVVASNDGGQHWKSRATFDVQQGSHIEPMIVERRDGSLCMFIRTGGEVRPGEFHPRGIAQSVSLDRGQSWSEPRMTDIASPSSRFHFRRLPSGRMLLINHRGFDPQADGVAGRTHLTASLSDDDGASWSRHLLLHGLPPVRAAQPDATVCADGRLHILHSETDAVGQRRLVLHRITERDIDAGRLVDNKSFLGRVLP
jgi:hypothetical protein